MVLCQGLPDGPCPESRCDGTVHNTTYDLFLCSQCEQKRDAAVVGQTDPTRRKAARNKLGERASASQEPTQQSLHDKRKQEILQSLRSKNVPPFETTYNQHEVNQSKEEVQQLRTLVHQLSTKLNFTVCAANR